MAFPNIPQNFIVQQGNQQVYLSWDISAGATSYSVQRSTDGVNFTQIATPSNNNYLDTAVTLGTQYYYNVASVNTDGTSPYTTALSVVPTNQGEMSLGQIRLAAQQRADRVNSNFVTQQEWDSYINQSLYELYDLLITSYEEYYMAPPIRFVADGSTYLYDLPNGSNQFLDQNNNTITPPAFYKLMGVDLALNNANNAYVTINKFNFIDRNRFVYPNTASTIYGVFNLQYRLLGNKIEFIPTPSGNQVIRLWYIPRMTELLQDTDTTTQSVSGWIEYVIVKAAYLALTKEESDTTSLVQQLAALRQRIEETSVNRDAGQPDRISDVRQNGAWGINGGYSGSGSIGGW